MTNFDLISVSLRYSLFSTQTSKVFRLILRLLISGSLKLGHEAGETPSAPHFFCEGANGARASRPQCEPEARVPPSLSSPRGWRLPPWWGALRAPVPQTERRELGTAVAGACNAPRGASIEIPAHSPPSWRRGPEETGVRAADAPGKAMNAGGAPQGEASGMRIAFLEQTNS
jgi:hypothetical protein